MNQIDNGYRVETPEGIEILLLPAGPVVRAAAWTIDALIRYGVLFVISIVLQSLEAFGIGVLLILLFLAEWFYPVLFEVLRGATPGKRAFSLIVVNTNGTPVGWSTSMIRNLLRAVDFLPVGYCFGFVSMLLTRRFQRLGDLAADTLVVYQPTVVEHPKLPETEATAPPDFFDAEDKQAILSFAERHQQLSNERQSELANKLSELLPVQAGVNNGQQFVKTLCGFANWWSRGRQT